MELLDLQRNWDGLGEIDPLWAVLSDPDKRERGWDLDEFLATGRGEISGTLAVAERLGYPAARHAALDFGCGVGRLTQALCESFERCVGVDIAPSMIRQARELNRFGDRCEFVVNFADDLRILDDGAFDFIYSAIALQHIPPQYSLRYVAEFVRLLAPSGLATFDLPASPGNPSPLPREAFSAAIRPQANELRLPAGQQAAVHVTVTNTSRVAWTAPLNLGNHWLDGADELLTFEDARGTLPVPLGPGESVEAAISVTVPRLPGSYVLALDLVQEGVTWFGSLGSRVVGVRVIAEDAHDAPPADDLGVDGPLVPAMGMYGVPQDVVIRTLADAGGLVVAVEPSFAGGDGWIGYRYAVTPR